MLTRKQSELLLFINKRLNDAGYGYFEGCFANLYEGERDHLGWHADDDPGIDHTKPIAVVSFGAERAIQVRPKLEYGMGLLKATEASKTFMLESGSLFIMPAGSQFTHEHRIPKVGEKTGERISLTFRGLVP